MNAGKKKINSKLMMAISFLAVLYVADAAYPHWSFSCHSTTKMGMVFNAAQIPELSGTDNPRVFQPSKPDGCELYADNMLRRVFDWCWDHFSDEMPSGRF